MSNLLARLLTAAVAIPFLILAINWRNPIGVELIVIAASAIGLREWMNMTMPAAPLADRAFAVALGVLVFSGVLFFAGVPLVVPALDGAATMAVFLYFLFRLREMDKVAARVASAIAGIHYVLLLVFLGLLKQRDAGAGAFGWERHASDGWAWIYVTLTIAWISDTGAYFAGRFLGPRLPRKLYESVSPKKTVVGFFGGVLGSYLAVVLAKVWYFPSLSWLDTAAIAIPANLLGQMGDLCESLIKRSVGVKDSGALLPGHGGMLDRIDALLFVAPYVYCYARWIFGLL